MNVFIRPNSLFVWVSKISNFFKNVWISNLTNHILKSLSGFQRSQEVLLDLTFPVYHSKNRFI